MENQTEQLKGIVSDFNQNQGNNAGSAPQPAQQVKYAGFWIRFAAAFIDGIILMIPAGIIQAVIGMAIAISGMPDFMGSTMSWIIGMAITWAYAIFMIHNYQATLGKMALGIKVISGEGGNLPLGKIVLRETLGKIVSSYLTLMIGYIIAGFTERKRALHDMIAGSVVIYKDPNKKSKGWLIGLIVGVCLIIPIIGILASIVLVSLNSARTKANDAGIKATISNTMVEAIIYLDEKETLKGFVPNIPLTENMKSCSGEPIVNISPDGQNIAIFAKLCSDDGKYFCDDINSNVQEVDGVYVGSGKAVCPGTVNIK